MTRSWGLLAACIAAVGASSGMAKEAVLECGGMTAIVLADRDNDKATEVHVVLAESETMVHVPAVEFVEGHATAKCKTEPCWRSEAPDYTLVEQDRDGNEWRWNGWFLHRTRVNIVDAAGDPLEGDVQVNNFHDVINLSRLHQEVRHWGELGMARKNVWKGTNRLLVQALVVLNSGELVAHADTDVKIGDVETRIAQYVKWRGELWGVELSSLDGERNPLTIELNQDNARWRVLSRPAVPNVNPKKAEHLPRLYHLTKHLSPPTAVTIIDTTGRLTPDSFCPPIELGYN